MRRLYPLLARLSASDVPVIIEGETGTGKELVAESIHEQGRRAQRPFVVFDCTAVPPSLVESALFGHERGAFTGAVGPRKGVFEQAHGGTLLIDEIGDLALGLQAKLLRAVERHEVQRVGGTSWIKVDVRVLCATRRDLEREIQEGRFRDDLYYRLAVARIELPPLRRRGADVTLLAEYFWRTLGGGDTPVPADLLGRLDGYAWPGNIRELHNAVVHRLALGDLSELEGLWRRMDAQGAPATPAAVELPPVPERVPASAAPSDIIAAILEEALPFPMAREKILRDFERRYVEWIVERHGGNMTRAAAASGMARRSLYAIKSRAAK
jgi:DNA-binding NtrC family response regulator